ncbi:hypothetical protein [Leptolyngbya phage Lbo-JY46]
MNIKKGKHYNKWSWIPKPLINPKKITIEFVVTDAFIYEHTNKECIGDVNKLGGFSRGHHHKNSFRFGWEWKQDQLHMYRYVYEDGVRSITFIKSYKKGETVLLTEEFDKGFCLGYRLSPYFGGNCPSDKDRKAKIKLKIK